MTRASWYGQRLTVRWCADTAHWVLRRGSYRMASSLDWHELARIAFRVADRERREKNRRAWIHKVVNYG